MRLPRLRPALLFALALTWASGSTTALAKTVLITGANSGIGLEFARQYAADGWHVIATHRRDGIPRSLAALASRHDKLQVETLDVTNHASIDALAAKLADTPIDVLLNNAGIVGTMEDPAQQFGTLDYDLLDSFWRTNAMGPLKVAEAFFTNVQQSEDKKIIGISTLAASIGGAAESTGRSIGIRFRYAYNISKAALNMAYVGLANDVRDDGVCVGLLHPGLVRVARTEQYEMTPQMEAMMIDVEDSVSQMRRVIDGWTMEASGAFLAYDGQPQDW